MKERRVLSKVKKVFSSNIVLAALIVIGVGLVLSIIGGFRYAYGTNDDYALSLLMNGGEERLFFISYYAGFFFSHLQQLFPAVNCYGISQVVLGAAALLAINYVFFSRLGKPLGAFISLVTDVLLYSISVMIVQFTQTTTLICAGGTLLLIHAHFTEQRKKPKIVQYIFAAFLIIVSSFYRFMSFRVVAVFSFILLFCMLIIELSRENKALGFFSRILEVLKRNWRFLVCFVLIFAVCFAGNFLSNTIKNSDPSYVAYSEGEKGRSLLTDYPLANYKENVDFYRENNVYSSQDIQMINRGQIDPYVMDSESSINIGEYSVKYLQKGKSNLSYAVSETMEKLRAAMWQQYDNIIAFKQYIPIQMSYKAFVIGFVLFWMLIAALLVFLWKLLRRKLGFAPLIYGSVPLVIFKVLLAMLWLAFYIVYPFSLLNCMLLPVCGIILLTIRNSNWVHTISCWIFTLATMALYGYQVCFRLNFRSTYIFAVPAFLFLCFLFEFKNMEGLKNSKPVVRGISAGIPVVLALVIAFNIMPMTWRSNFVSKTGVYQTTIYDYITDHPDTTYAMVVPCAISVDPNYNNALLSSDMPENTIFYGSWNIYSNYNDKLLEEKGIENLFRDMINNDKICLVTKNKNDFPKIIGTFLTNHYAQEGKKIKLEQITKINSVGNYWGGIKQNDPLVFYKVIEE